MGKKLKILHVEDDPAHAELLSLHLQYSKVDLDLKLMEDGEKAMNYLFPKSASISKADLPDLVLLDLRIPKIDGFEILKRIRSEKNTKDLAVYILTSSGAEIDRQKAESFGANGYLIKPEGFKLFVEKLEEENKSNHKGVDSPLH